MKVRLEGGRLLDPTKGELFEANVAYDDVTGLIVAVGDDLGEADRVVTLHGELILPGFVDLHVHLRDPGFTAKETLATGLQAAAAGGFTQVACMPNTNPPTDQPAIVRDIIQRGRDAKKADVHPIACITIGQAGDELTDFEALKAAGAVALSDDGKGVQHGARMLEAMERAKAAHLPVVIHSEDETLSLDGVIHPDAAKRIGVKGLLPESEAAMIARDILLAERTGVHLHVCHVSTEQSVALIRWAKARGVRITAEVTPHHLLLTESIITHDDAVFKVNPPLQGERDRHACLEGFLDGTLDIIATDHAPHTAEEKSRGIAKAPFGMVGIETVFPLLYTYLVAPGVVPLNRLVDAMTRRPTELFGLPGGIIRPGATADLAIVSTDEERRIDPERFYSKGRNTPFANWHAAGWTVRTILRGKQIFEQGEERFE
ncbi:dihydroorotase [Alicyclobacillus fastidiosus]|uniref:Dihydroorotase n=1 Tax=Alicyclobacillus fastidiosus TaxID=392011 RepID=A0ABV5AHQ5_9BACL|nr:dihydroorotase [Alicyclobacillus fastidiosus]WEH08095.1 dihydroorotase [Alicyclobacillus fastidiosus]